MTALEDEKTALADSSPKQLNRFRRFLDSLPGTAREYSAAKDQEPCRRARYRRNFPLPLRWSGNPLLRAKQAVGRTC